MLFTLSLVLLAGCVGPGEYYEPDTQELKQVKTEVQESTFETPTLGDPKTALADHRAFIDAYYDGAPDIKAAALHRLADLYMIMEIKEYERQNSIYIQKKKLYAQGRLRRSPTPPYGVFRQASNLYEDILQRYPSRPENDRILYQLARIYEALKLPEKKTKMLEALVADYPDSRYHTEAQFRLAEMYFNSGMYSEAADAYISAARGLDFSVFDRARKGAKDRAETALSEARRKEEEETALFKAGWAQIPLDNYESAVSTFQELLGRKEKILDASPFQYDPKRMSRRDWDFVQEVLRGLAIALSNWVPADKLDDYFEKVGHWKYEHLIYQKIANLNMARNRYYDAIKVYESYLKLYPMHAQAPDMMLGIIDGYQHLKLVDLTNQSRMKFLREFGEDSKWYRKAAVPDRERIHPFLKENIYHFAVFYHSEAQKTKRVSDYKKAIEWYRRFLKAYPKETESSRVNFLLAEGLYEIKDYEDASTEYLKTAYEYPLHHDSAESGYAAVLAIEKVWEKTGKDVKKDQSRETAARLASAADRFAETFTTDERGLDVRLKGAEIYYKLGNLKDARRMASEVTVTSGVKRDPAIYKAQLLIASTFFDEKSYEKAASVYRRLNVTSISPEQRMEVRKLWAAALYKNAEALKARGLKKDAEEAFYLVQRQVPGSEVAPVALYDAGLMAINRKGFEDAVRVFGLLAHEYPKSELSKKVPPLILKTEQDMLDKGQYKEARILADGLKDLGTNIRGDMVYQADLMIANRFFEKKSYDKAVDVYSKMDVNQLPDTDREEVKRLWASALYKQAEELKKAGKLMDAEKAFKRVQNEVPGTETGPVALYDAGLLAAQRKDYNEALKTFGLLVRQYPEGTHAVHATVEMARIHEETGQLSDAALEYERVGTLSGEPKLAAESLLAAGWIYEQTKDWPRAARVYQRYLDSNPGEYEKEVEIRYKIIEVEKKQKHHDRARQLLQDFIQRYASLQKDSATSSYLAKAYLESGDYLRRDYNAVKLVEPLDENLAKKKDLLAEVLNEYIQAANYEIADVMTQAAYQIGAVFEEFRTDLLGSQRPKGLTASQLEQYNFLLEEQAFPFEEKAIAAFESNVKRTQQLGLYDDWVKRSYEDLARLVPGRYKKTEMEEVVTR
jgi:TolA-binding protein